MFSQTREGGREGGDLFINNKAKVGNMIMNYYSCWIWNIFTAAGWNIVPCWHQETQNMLTLTRQGEVGCKWGVALVLRQENPVWSQLLLVGPGAAMGWANILNNPTSLSNSLPLWSNVRILARNPGTDTRDTFRQKTSDTIVSTFYLYILLALGVGGVVGCRSTLMVILIMLIMLIRYNLYFYLTSQLIMLLLRTSEPCRGLGYLSSTTSTPITITTTTTSSSSIAIKIKDAGTPQTTPRHVVRKSCHSKEFQVDFDHQWLAKRACLRS